MVNEYVNWLKSQTAILNQLGYDGEMPFYERKISLTAIEIVTPFLDPDNDYIRIYVVNNIDGTFCISDDLDIYHNICACFTHDSQKRIKLTELAKSMGVNASEEMEIFVTCQKEDLFSEMTRFICAVKTLYAAIF